MLLVIATGESVTVAGTPANKFAEVNVSRHASIRIQRSRAEPAFESGGTLVDVVVVGCFIDVLLSAFLLLPALSARERWDCNSHAATMCGTGFNGVNEA